MFANIDLNKLWLLYFFCVFPLFVKVITVMLLTIFLILNKLFEICFVFTWWPSFTIENRRLLQQIVGSSIAGCFRAILKKTWYLLFIEKRLTTESLSLSVISPDLLYHLGPMDSYFSFRWRLALLLHITAL